MVGNKRKGDGSTQGTPSKRAARSAAEAPTTPASRVPAPRAAATPGPASPLSPAPRPPATAPATAIQPTTRDGPVAPPAAGQPALQHQREQAASSALGPEGLVVMVLDVVDEAGGRFHVWGTSPGGASVLVRVDDFQPYLYLPAPHRAARPGAADDFTADDCRQVAELLRRHLPPDCRLAALEPLQRRPIMYYRPSAPEGATYLKASFAPGCGVKKAAAALSKVLLRNALAGQGWAWQETELYEHEVAALQRFLVDASLAGGAWLHVPPAGGGAAGYQEVPPGSRLSSCAVEVRAPWRALQCLSPDATQLADAAWAPPPFLLPGPHPRPAPRWQEAAGAAREGVIAPLRLLTLDVLLAPADGAQRVPVAARDPVISVACLLHSSAAPAAVPTGGTAGLGLEAEDEEGEGEGTGLGSGELDLAGAGEPGQAAPASLPDAATGESTSSRVFTWAPGAARSSMRECVSGAVVELFGSEAEMLAAWHDFFRAADPDALVLFQARDTVGALIERFKALRLGGGGLHISRLAGAAAASRPLQLKRVVMYSAAWVKSQSRMASTSNQETFRLDLDGRVVFDILRQVLTAVNLASFSLADCCSVLLGRRLEVLPHDALAALAALPRGAPPAARAALLPGEGEALHSEQAAGGAAALRLARYTMTRVDCVTRLLRRLATIPETIELARATGLTLGQALYNAQMIRTWSLLLRNAARRGYIVSGRVEPGQLVESPFLMHPVELATTGLYRSPVAILDFASLYPSLYRAHNLCYTSLVHPDDAAALAGQGDLTITPTGAAFVKPAAREGILPAILAALITARAATRAQLKGATDPATRAVLDSRQKALKVTANALYGFTGAGASPLQCVPLADSCLALGAAATRRACEQAEALARGGQLGPLARDARVIYAQTDSVFMHFPSASAAQAIDLGQQVAKLVSRAFPPEMELKFERVSQPFMLLHVNRYAGRTFETAAEVESGSGVLMTKGLKSIWRQAAPIVRTTLQGALQRIIMQDDVAAAVAFVEREVRRLLAGRCSLDEFVMTGGLWRITGQQVASAAAGEPTTAAGGEEAGGGEVRGPHAALAVRLQQRDPGRTFVLGERLQYVLLPGQRTQDEAAEDPQTAARAGLAPDYELYWRNKLQRPLSEIFATCLSPAALQALLNGPHTLVRADPLLAAAPVGAPRTPPPAGGRKRGAGGRQTGLGQFFTRTAQCLACRRTLAPGLAAREPPPGLCQDCTKEDGRWEATYLALLAEADRAVQQHATAHAICARCHSGGLLGPVACANGECDVLYARLGSAALLPNLQQSLSRMDCIDW